MRQFLSAVTVGGRTPRCAADAPTPTLQPRRAGDWRRRSRHADDTLWPTTHMPQLSLPLRSGQFQDQSEQPLVRGRQAGVAQIGEEEAR